MHLWRQRPWTYRIDAPAGEYEHRAAHVHDGCPLGNIDAAEQHPVHERIRPELSQGSSRRRPEANPRWRQSIRFPFDRANQPCLDDAERRVDFPAV